MAFRILLHVSGEIGTKGKNRIFFERKLASNITKKIPEAKIKRSFGSFLLDIRKEDKEKLKKIPGIAWITEVKEVEARKEHEAIKEILTKTLELIKEKELREVDVEVKRAWKGFGMSSQEVREQLVRELKRRELFKPKATAKIFVEINKDWIVVGGEKEKGISGLPSGTSGRVVALLSGGIDSAVASFLAMKKGLEVIFVHFHNYASNDHSQIDAKIIGMVKVLNGFQLKSALYIIPLAKVQKEIIKRIDARHRYLVYKYLMLKIAEKIAKQNKAEALLTGDSLGQVASQTLTNITTLQSFVKIPILMPLLAFSKDEIVEMAKKIGTYELSIMHYSDCCSFMIAKHPATKIGKEKFRELLEKTKDEGLKKALAEAIKNKRKEIVE
jgi:thiamine biosynthesis protein ThiI